MQAQKIDQVVEEILKKKDNEADNLGVTITNDSTTNTKRIDSMVQSVRT